MAAVSLTMKNQNHKSYSEAIFNVIFAASHTWARANAVFSSTSIVRRRLSASRNELMCAILFASNGLDDRVFFIFVYVCFTVHPVNTAKKAIYKY